MTTELNEKNEKKEEMDRILKKLEEGVLSVFQSEKYLEYLGFCARFPKYSLNNQILIMCQNPNATLVQSFGAWKKAGRYVKAGEKALKILAPIQKVFERIKKDMQGNIILDANGNPEKEQVRYTTFKVVNTFDVSQTDGEEIPMLCAELDGSVERFDGFVSALKEYAEIPVEFEKMDENGPKGYFSPAMKKIVIKNGMSEAQTLKTLIHEITHSRLHADPNIKKSREQKECEAESVAYIVCQHLGVDTSDYSFEYLASWSDGKELKELRESLNLIRKTASDIIQKVA